MSHPIPAVALAFSVALALGAVAVLPPPKPAPHATLPLPKAREASARAEPQRKPTNGERLDALQRQLRAIAADQREIAGELKALARERSTHE
jgi:hypothetical protein